MTREQERDRYIEAILGGRLRYHVTRVQGWHGRTLRDCSTCRGKGSLPLGRLIRDGILGFLLVVFALIGTIVAVGS